MACLRGKAVDYVFNRPKDLRADYYTLKDMLSQRYNIAELPGTARRQLNTMRQEERESLEDYADRVLGKVSETYPNVEEDVAQALGTESFLRGCWDRSAAYAASEHKPDTIYKALQCVKDAAANLRVFGRPAMTTRQVTFADPERESTTDGVARLSKEQEKMMQLMTEMMSRLEKNTARRNTSPSPDRGRNRSPSPCYNCRERGHMARECPKPRRCFNCNKTGHMAEECKEEKQGFGSPSVRKSVESSEEGSEWLRTTPSMDTGAGRPVVPTEKRGLDQDAEEGCVNIDCMQEEGVEILLEDSVTGGTGICGLSEMGLEMEADAVKHEWDALSLDQNVALQEHGPGSATENGNMRKDTEQVGEGVSSVSTSGQTVRQLSWSRSPGLSLMIDVFIGKMRVPAIVDTAAQVSLISSSLCRRLNLKSAEEQVQLRNAQVGSIMMGSVLKPTGVQVGGRSYFWELIEADINDSFILGLDFLTAHKCKIDLEDSSLEFPGGEKVYARLMRNGEDCFNVCRLTVAKRITVPALSVKFIRAKFHNPVTDMDFAIEPNHKLPIAVMTGVIKGGDTSKVCVVNFGEVPVQLQRNAWLGTGVEVDAVFLDTGEEETE